MTKPLISSRSFTTLSLCVLFLFVIGLSASAQTAQRGASAPTHAHIYNKEYDIHLHIDLNGQTMPVPQHDLYGPLPGYLGKTGSTFFWLVLELQKKGDTMTLQLVNDYGSEDLSATLKQKNDSVFTLTQIKGSTIKIPVNNKWVKLPKTLTFIRKK
jgi:hypothetical protein